MDKQILQTENAENRKQILKDTCLKTEEFTYSKHYTDEELVLKKDELSQLDIKLDRIELEKKEVIADFNARIKALKEERQKTLDGVRTGAEEVTEIVYLLDDQEERRIGYYNSNGQRVYERPMLKEERQLRIVDKEILTGTNY